MSRIVGGSVLLFLNITPGEKSHLDFQSFSGERRELAVVENGKWVRNTSNDRFGQRLEMVSETLLRITDLEKEDSGLFKFSVMLPGAMIQDLTFSLTVYARVPEPRIQVLDTSDGCSITLWCLVDGEERYNISWEREGTLNGSWDSHQFSDNSSSLRLSWEPELSDFNVTCVVSNPVDRNKTSFDPLRNCPPKAPRNEHNEIKWIYLLILIAVIPVLVIAIMVCVYRTRIKRTKRKEGSGDLSVAASVQGSEDQLFIQSNLKKRAESGWLEQRDPQETITS